MQSARPLGSKTQVRIAIEAEAILGVISQVERVGLIWFHRIRSNAK
jgi:hypothetical protein